MSSNALPLALPELERIRAEKARRSLGEYIRQAWPIIEPGTPYLDNWHVHAVCDYLEAVTAGQCKRLLLNVPPRYMKSTAVSVMWPTWEWIRFPAQRWLFASYSSKLSTDHSVFRRNIVQSDWYERHWGDVYQLTTDQNVKTEFRNTQQGVMVATSIGGSVTGKGGNRIVVDDPHNPLEAASDIQREAGILFFDQSLYTRLNDKKNGAIVIVMQRLHERDLSGHVLEGLAKNDDKWDHLCLPAEAEGRTVISVPSGRTYEREDGELLWPEREGPPEIKKTKARLGPYGYAGQYQQRPAPAGGGRFKAAWFRYYHTSEDGEFYQLLAADGSFKAVRVRDCDRFATMDPAGTEKEQNNKPCYTVISVWAITPDHEMLLLDQYRAQVESPVVADKGVELSRRWDLPWIGIEKNGLGLGVVQTIRRRGTTVKAIVARGSKEARSETAEIRMSAGMVFFAHGAPWLFDLEKELLQFPAGEYSDQVDALSHAAMHVQRTRGAPDVPGDAEHAAAQQERHETESQEQDQQDRQEQRLESYDERSMWVGGDDD